MYDVAQETIEQTTKCKRNHDCLVSEQGCLCTVELELYTGGLYVKFEAIPNCSYNTLFGTGLKRGICRCPIRYELYKRYRV